jgi:GTPase SAR1 family protein
MFEDDLNEENRPISVRKSSCDSLFKVILLGDSKVGKSSILMRLVVRIFQIEMIIGRAIQSGTLANSKFRFCNSYLTIYLTKF